MTFRSVFIAVFLGTSVIVAALVINSRRPSVETDQPSAQWVRATGKCAKCHRSETSAIVHQFEGSRHAAAGVSCLDCHAVVEGQQRAEHRGFEIAEELTSKNCAGCHVTEYRQYARSRHAGPAWAAVAGSSDFSPEQLEVATKYHRGAVERPANVLALLEGPAAITLGCEGCHDIGRPNEDGSFGTCTHCHARHSSSVALAREPQTCGQCHMGPDHSQIEIYNESKHGVLFKAGRADFNLHADPKHLTTADMPVPTCATCHMSGLEGLKVSHDVTERLSWYLFAPVSAKRPGYERRQGEMKEVCLKCHTQGHVEEFYGQAEAVVLATNEKVGKMQTMMAELREEGLVPAEPFSQPIQFLEFDYWHYFGRTAKHGAFMGGADFVQWHGNYELLKMMKEIEALAHELRAEAR